MTYLFLGMGFVIGGMLPMDVGVFEYFATMALATATPSAAGLEADAAGFELILPLARWRGYGGDLDNAAIIRQLRRLKSPT